MKQQKSKVKVSVTMEGIDDMEISHKSSFLPGICAPVLVAAMTAEISKIEKAKTQVKEASDQLPKQESPGHKVFYTKPPNDLLINESEAMKDQECAIEDVDDLKMCNKILILPELCPPVSAATMAME
eukprot:CAMPEP_0194371360 /NCGR_PEP_ID=MMETSP0174-20130528/19772_1 /TAXON_ID=216777 /ORGANISM="Proboscia alata, Strain PI-D3" /LENGTH=126 /DNA_ID=CAMNT_0039149377 /DNA_START=96 /DNA_END=473 /DNA_ORIENTATION=+